MSGVIENLADHPSKAFKVSGLAFLPHTKNTVVKLRRGECLWTLSAARGLEEAGYCGAQEVCILTEDFGSWPIFAFKVRVAHADKWRSISKDAVERMMVRCLSELPALTVPTPA